MLQAGVSPRLQPRLPTEAAHRCDVQELRREKGRLQAYLQEAFKDACKEASKDSPRSRRIAEH